MVHHLPITISNRTSAQIRISHLSFNDTVLPHQTSLTKAIPTKIQLNNLKTLISVEAERPNEIQIKFLKSKRRRIRKSKKFWKLKIDYRVNQMEQMLEKGKRSRFEVFQSISDDGSITLMAIKARDFSSWMSNLSDAPSISSLILPGTHNTCALYGWPMGTCQTRTLSRQLKDGIRFIDLRLGLPGGPGSVLTAFHGFHSQLITFKEILEALIRFLTEQPTETIIVSIKQEDHQKGFKEAVMKEMVNAEGPEAFKTRWWLDNCLPPTLGQVRGKLVLFSRIEDSSKPSFSSDTKVGGIELASWPNNSREIWQTQVSSTNVAVQDWYDIGSFLSISKKSSLACVSLCRALWETSPPSPPAEQPSEGNVQSEESNEIQVTPQGSQTPEQSTQSRPAITPTWVITFLSASSPIFAFPVICAKGFGWPKMGMGIEGVNSRVARWLVSRREEEGGPSVKGVVCLMDFYQSPKESMISLLVDCNF